MADMVIERLGTEQEKIRLKDLACGEFFTIPEYKDIVRRRTGMLAANQSCDRNGNKYWAYPTMCMDTADIVYLDGNYSVIPLSFKLVEVSNE